MSSMVSVLELLADVVQMFHVLPGPSALGALSRRWGRQRRRREHGHEVVAGGWRRIIKLARHFQVVRQVDLRKMRKHQI